MTVNRSTRPLPHRWPATGIAAALVATLSLTACSQTVAGTGHVGAASTDASTGSRATPSAGPSGPPSQATISFRSCAPIFDPSVLGLPPDRAKELEFGCATMAVPLDYTKATGQQIQLSLVRVHDKAGSGQQPLLLNPGGPGGSGVQLALGMAGQVDPKVLEHFDLIGFDPRGVGLSSPITCVSDAEKDKLNAASPDVLTAAGFAEARQLAKQVADACETKYGPALAQYNTVNTARDMDQIRQGLGAQRTDYLGFSYGTELGSIYAHLFPKTVGAMVLDGAVDPLTDDIASFADQLGGFEHAYDQFAADCAKRSSCSSLGNPRDVVEQIVATANKTPLRTGTDRRLTSALALTGVLDALYSASSWPKLASALADAKGGDGKALLDLADEYNQRFHGTYSNIMEANTTISCNDSKTGPSDETIRATAKAWSSKYPIFGLWAAGSLFICQQWQPDRTPLPLPQAPTPEPVLVVGNLNDPATPYQGAIDLARTMGNARLLSWNGEGHTSYLQGSTCVDEKVNAYLVDGTLPPPNTTCPR